MSKVRNSLAVCFIVFNLVFLFSASAQAEDGLTAEVYNVLGQNNAPVLPANAQPILVTQVPNVDFDWGGGQILNSGRYEDVIVKLTGNFTPISTGTTYITAPADDGVRLYLDGQLYINDWYDKGGGGSTADVPTTQAVPMVIEMWYYENGGGANVKLLWFTDNGWEVIPASAFVAPVPVVVPEPEPTPEPTPSVSPTPEPEPVPVEPVPVPEEPVVVPVEPEVIPVPEPQPVPQPVPVVPPVAPPVEEPAPVEPEPIPLPAPEPEPEPQPEPPAVEPTPEPVQPEPPIEEPEPPIVQAEDTDLESLEPDTPVELSNGVVVTAEVAIAVQLLQDPAAMLQEIFTDPGAALAALGSVGADMTEEVREKSEKVIVAAVIAGNIATTASISAASAGAGYRRKP